MLEDAQKALVELGAAIGKTTLSAKNVSAFRDIYPLPKPKTKKIEIAPAYGLYRFLGSICPKALRERELDALLADSLQLYFEKLEEGDEWGAWRVKWSMRGWLLWAVFGGAATALTAMLLGKRKPSR